jgi:alkylhydroperoxidase family enzyme
LFIKHTREARKLEQKEERIYLISVSREAPNVFTEGEQLLLDMTEEITIIHAHGLSDALYEAINLFGKVKTAQIIMAVIPSIHGIELV